MKIKVLEKGMNFFKNLPKLWEKLKKTKKDLEEIVDWQMYNVLNKLKWDYQELKPLFPSL